MALSESQVTEKSSTVKKKLQKHFANKPLDKFNNKEKLPTKIVIRRLPPNMDEKTFIDQVSPIPNYDYLYLVNGDPSMAEHSFGRAYIDFTDPNDVYDFREKFDSYVFVDDTGHEYTAIVEYAPFQRVPKKRARDSRIDRKIDTIETDSYYKAFVEELSKPTSEKNNGGTEKPEFSYQIQTEGSAMKVTTTPLLEFLKNRRAEKNRVREERREERKRRDLERKRFREEERKKRLEEKSPAKVQSAKFPSTASSSSNKVENNSTISDKPEKVIKPSSKNELESEKPHKKETRFKYEDKREETKKYPPKREFVKKYRKAPQVSNDDSAKKYNDFKNREPKSDSNRVQQKKVKKYSEKREERKIEAQKKLEQQSTSKPDEVKVADRKPGGLKETKVVNDEKDVESSTQRRIRNKDRPTIAIYRPGMLSRRKQGDAKEESTDKKSKE